MKATPPPIDVRRYDAVAKLLLDHPDLDFPEVARRTGVSESTVRKIWDGAISRPPAIVLERLAKPRRCRDCGALCSEWPCVLCSMRRRSSPSSVDQPPMRFVYKRQTK
jgi:hypothetical protein